MYVYVSNPTPSLSKWFELKKKKVYVSLWSIDALLSIESD